MRTTAGGGTAPEGLKIARENRITETAIAHSSLGILAGLEKRDDLKFAVRAVEANSVNGPANAPFAGGFDPGPGAPGSVWNVLNSHKIFLFPGEEAPRFFLSAGGPWR